MDLREALEISLEYENKVRDHYVQGLELIKDPVGRRIFKTLGEEEQNHVDFIQNQLDRLENRTSSESKLGRMIPEDWITNAQKKMEQPPSATIASQRDIDLVKLALRLEHETSDFYRSLMSKLDKAEDRAVFEPLIEIEDGHISIVQAELDALQGLGFWFDFQEFSLEAG